MAPWSSKLDGNGSRETSKGFSRPSDFPSFVLCGVAGGGGVLEQFETVY